MSTRSFSLGQLGWRAFFSQQLTLEDLESGYPARVAGVHRNTLTVLCERGEIDVALSSKLASATVPTIGDWLLIEHGVPRAYRLLERYSFIARLMAGLEQREQPIAANLDTLFAVTSCNEDFNASRLERYLALAMEARIEPVIVLTKTDLCHDRERYVELAQRAAASTCVIATDATSPAACDVFAPWLEAGRTVAFVGSSGVGKSTLINALMGAHIQATSEIRKHDSKGKHTTTARQMLQLPAGAWVVDTPGMRELKVGALKHGVTDVFQDIEDLAEQCRFRDCNHDGDDGCAVRAAIDAGRFDARRLRSYLKLRREAANAARTLHERRERERQLGRMYKTVQNRQRKDKGSG